MKRNPVISLSDIWIHDHFGRREHACSQTVLVNECAALVTPQGPRSGHVSHTSSTNMPTNYFALLVLLVCQVSTSCAKTSTTHYMELKVDIKDIEIMLKQRYIIWANIIFLTLSDKWYMYRASASATMIPFRLIFWKSTWELFGHISKNQNIGHFMVFLQ